MFERLKTKTEFVPRSEHRVVTRTSQLMLYKEMIAVWSANTICGQNVENFNDKFGDTWSDHWALKGFAAW